MKNRLSKILAEAGVASRRACEELIFEGRVTVNGRHIKVPQTQVDPSSDRIEVDGAPLPKQKKVYIVLNKPKGYVCTAAPGKHRRVLDLFADRPERLFTVGRLDKETTGLLLLTNDGHFAQRVIHPRSSIEKEYRAEVSHDPSPDHLRALAKGTRVEGVWVKPRHVSRTRKGTVRVVVMEGRKREVRLMLKAAGLQCHELSRVRIGNLRLGQLPIGAHKELTLRALEPQIFIDS